MRILIFLVLALPCLSYDKDKQEIATSYQSGFMHILNYRIEF